MQLGFIWASPAHPSRKWSGPRRKPPSVPCIRLGRARACCSTMCNPQAKCYASRSRPNTLETACCSEARPVNTICLPTTTRVQGAAAPSTIHPPDITPHPSSALRQWHGKLMDPPPNPVTALHQRRVPILGGRGGGRPRTGPVSFSKPQGPTGHARPGSTTPVSEA
jgi:hypothetical protein